MKRKEIENLEDIKQLVNKFYDTVRKNSKLGPIFDDVIKDNWDKHLPKMYSFWQTILLNEHTYFGDPFVPHMPLPIESEHFEIWLNIWKGTVDDLFVGERADEAKWRGERMAAVFLSKLEYIRMTQNDSV